MYVKKMPKNFMSYSAKFFTKNLHQNLTSLPSLVVPGPLVLAPAARHRNFLHMPLKFVSVDHLSFSEPFFNNSIPFLRIFRYFLFLKIHNFFFQFQKTDNLSVKKKYEKKKQCCQYKSSTSFEKCRCVLLNDT